MNKRIGAVAGAAVILILLSGCAGRTSLAAGASTVTDRDSSCPWTLAQSKYYATHPSKVLSTATAGCVIAYANSYNLSNSFRQSVSYTHSTTDDMEYGDPGGNGVYSTSSHGSFSTVYGTAYEVDAMYDQQDQLDNGGTDATTLRYYDADAGLVYTDTPQAASVAAQGWSSAAINNVQKIKFRLDQSGWYSRTGFPITKWTKAASNGINTWTFTMSDSDGYNKASLTLKIASTGELQYLSASTSFDGAQHTGHVSLSASYGPSVRGVVIPAAVKQAATGS